MRCQGETGRMRDRSKTGQKLLFARFLLMMVFLVVLPGTGMWVFAVEKSDFFLDAADK